jgi:hypothetical protein
MEVSSAVTARSITQPWKPELWEIARLRLSQIWELEAGAEEIGIINQEFIEVDRTRETEPWII